jgi:hypothetical protein
MQSLSKEAWNMQSLSKDARYMHATVKRDMVHAVTVKKSHGTCGHCKRGTEHAVTVK